MQQAAADGRTDAYEVTQLWNSLLGLIVAPRELDVDRLPETSLEDLRAAGWPDPTTGGRLTADTLRGLITTLRHVVAHFNVEFHPDETREIQAVTMWNVPPGTGRNGRHLWDGRLDIYQLERLARMIARTYLDELRARAA